MEYTFLPLGDNALIIKFGNKICPQINHYIRNCVLNLKQKKIQEIIEWTPAYTSLTIFYKPDMVSYAELCHMLTNVFKNIKQDNIPVAREVIIPTCYGGKLGPDLKNVAEKNKLSVEEVIKIHSASSYLVYMLGFSPGFPYLGGMDKKIATPRLESPRANVKAGSVGIAGEQTGIYSLDTPGGWQIIGQTPLKLFDINNDDPFLLNAGDIVKLKPISEEEFYKCLKLT